jgi:hypothetical protein
MWLLARSGVVAGLSREATFLIGLPFLRGLDPKAWGFWREMGGHRWIGPRHTNFDEGSICAFAPQDNVWCGGGELTTLVDVYSVWALRHLHLEVFGRWPGKQYALTGGDPRAQAFYRLRECQDSELCGCGSATATYARCCKPRDESYDFAESAKAFLREAPAGFSGRRPPDAVAGFVSGSSPVPPLREVHIQLRLLYG